MTRHYDIQEILDLASDPEHPRAAWEIKEELGLPVSVRRVQQIVKAHLGSRPSRRTIQRRDVLRSRVVAYMESQGLSKYYCYLGHVVLHECAIRELRRDDDLGSLVFVCSRHATVADV